MTKNLQVNNEELRSLALEALKDPEEKTLQFSTLYRSVAKIARKRRLIPSINNGYYGGSNETLERYDCARVQNILWDFIIEGIIRPGLHDGTNNDLPFFHITEKGEEILRHGDSSPYDPDNYIKRLMSNIDSIDAVVLTYLNECLSTFRIGSLLSSTITLGVASEKAFLLLIEACADSIIEEKRKERFIKDTSGKMIKRQYDEFMKLYQGYLRKMFPGDINEDFETNVNGVFSMIRNYRNDAGHPTGRMVSREVAYANIQVFPTYLKKVYSAIKWLENNSV